MSKSEPLIIYAPSQGIAKSPHVGFSDVRNLDIFSIPGIARLNNKLDKKSSTTVDAQIKWIVKNPASPANVYAIDSNGSVYNSSDSGGTWAELSDREGAGQGLVVWKDYLFVAEGDKIDVFGPLSGSPTWDDDWQSLPENDGDWQPMLVSKNDGKLYIGSGRYITSIEEVSGQDFDPDTGGTFTFTSQALDLPEDYRVKCLTELGDDLMIGTWQGSNIYDVKVADIFPWDRSSGSFRKPIQITENGVNSMLSKNGYLYILAGIEGKIYKSNGIYAWPIAQISETISDLSGGKYLEPFPGAIINYKDRVFFGVSDGGTSAIAGVGVYSLLETSSGNIITHEHTISTGNSGASNVAKVSALLGITRDTLLVGWRDNATYGIDKTDTSNYSTGYTAYFDSPLYRVGTFLNPRTFTKLDFYLAKELAANEGIRIQYRVNLTDSFTTIGTYTTTEIGTGEHSFHTEASIPSCELLQIRVSLTGTTTTPHFKALILD